MERQARRVVLSARDAGGAIIQTQELTSYEWYDGECPLNDSDEGRRRLSVRTIEGYETDQNGKIVQKWKNTYDAAGRLDELGEIESK